MLELSLRCFRLLPFYPAHDFLLGPFRACRRFTRSPLRTSFLLLLLMPPPPPPLLPLCLSAARFENNYLEFGNHAQNYVNQEVPFPPRYIPDRYMHSILIYAAYFTSLTEVRCTYSVSQVPRSSDRSRSANTVVHLDPDLTPCEMLRRTCVVQIQLRKHVLSHADCSTPTRQHELDRTDLRC